MSTEKAAADGRDWSEAAIGERVRMLRRRHRLSQRQLADRVGVTASFVSQLETGRASASVATLRALADSLGVLVAELLDPTPLPTARVVKAADAVWESGSAGARARAVTHAPQLVEAIWFTIPDGAGVGPQDVDVEANAETVVLVVGGRTVTVSVAEEEFVLERGDSLACDSGQLRNIANTSGEDAEVVVLSSPPLP